MDLANELFDYLNATAALLLAAVAVAQARRGGRPAHWGAAAFAALAAVLLMAAVRGEASAEWASRLIVCVLLAFPYLLLRFTASFGVVPGWLQRGAAAATAAILLASLVIPAFPEAGDSQPAWYSAYVAAVLVFWTVLSLGTIVGLWRGGTGQPTLTRRRTRLMSAATAAMNVLILLAPLNTSEGAAALTVSALLSLSLASFALGFAPPGIVRLAWRQPEQEALRRATEELVGATTQAEVTDTLLPHVVRLVGGSGAAVRDADGRTLASFGDVPARDDGGAASPRASEPVEIALSAPLGTLVVATSPLTPFFGREELGLLDGLAALADLSLARCALSERERDNQLALQLAKQEAERANAAKSDFLSRMSHELRTPMNVVLGFGQILELNRSLDKPDAEAVDHILKAGRHLLELINEILDLSTIESGRMSISPEPVGIAELAAEALDLIRPLADERSVQLQADLGGSQHVTADRQRLKQVLLNLLSNAVKYNRDGGEVAISCTAPANGRLRLLVADTGPGVPAAMKDKLFEPFERLGAERGHVPGTGLGLALSRQLIELMGGEIGVESRDGEGSVFWIELAVARSHDEAWPALAAHRNGTDETRRTTSPLGMRLLLVEDNLANLKVIESVLSSRTHVELLPAMTGRLGLELAREHRPDLILLDQHLPDLTGTQVLHRLKADPELRAIPVVIVSADATPGQVRRMRELGATDYLRKPLDVPEFLRVIDGILDAVQPAV